MPDDSMIIAVGGNDAAIYRYKIKQFDGFIPLIDPLLMIHGFII